jgi:hypothetical protein
MKKPKKKAPAEKTRKPIDWSRAEGVSIPHANRKRIAAATRKDRAAKKAAKPREDFSQAALQTVPLPEITSGLPNRTLIGNIG